MGFRNLSLMPARVTDCISAPRIPGWARSGPSNVLTSVTRLSLMLAGALFLPTCLRAELVSISGMGSISSGIGPWDLGLVSTFPVRRRTGGPPLFNEVTRCEERVGPEDVVVPCFEGMAMGWSWALWMCNSVLSHAGRIPGSLALRDRSAALTPTDKEAVMSPYVDNRNVIGITKSSVDFTFNRVVEDLEGLGLICHQRVDV